MFFSKDKKTIHILLLVAVIAISIYSYSYLNSKTSLSEITITNPAEKSAINGVVKISAKTSGNADSVKFKLTDEKDKTVKELLAYYENNEWVYYLNSLELLDGTYSLNATASEDTIKKENYLSLKIENGMDEDILAHKKDFGESNDIVAENTKTKELPPIENLASMAGANNEQQPPQQNEKIKQTATPKEIANAVFTALSNIYDTIDSNLSTTTITGQVAGAFQETTKTRKQENSETDKTNTTIEQLNQPAQAIEQPPQQTKNDKTSPTANPAANNWFNYNLKIIGLKNREIMKFPYTLSASCNNPLDSAEFILDNLETPEIDYTFKASNNYGYYTYWTYKLNSNDIATGDYLLYAKGTIDWLSYESPIIIVGVE